MNMELRAEVINVLNGLVGHVPNQDELGGCVYCGGSGKEGRWGYCDESYDCHQNDCEWVAGRRLLDELNC